MFDYRLRHRGLANTTPDVVRPLLSITYTKSWFKDTFNYPQHMSIDREYETMMMKKKEDKK